MNNYCIIGAGILGSVTAYKLARAGADVLIIDKAHSGQATDAAAGIVCPWLSQRRNKDWYRLAKGGARYYPELISELEQDGETATGYAKVGALSLHHDEKKLEAMEKRALKRREDAPEIGEITRLSPEDTKEKFPLLSDEFGSVYVSGAARVDGRALRNALQRAAEKHGAVFQHTEARLQRMGERVAVITEDKTFYPDKLILTAGGWTASLLADIGVKMNVSTQKAQICHAVLPHTDTASWPVIMPPTDQYILAFEQGRIVIGATHENERGFDDRITVGGVHEILSKALALAPGLEEAALTETRVGFRPFTPGFLPVIGALPDFPNIFAANGLGASGLTMGPFIGDQLAKLVMNQHTDIDLSPYQLQNALI